ncbi:MAG: hypothetical protein K8H99_11115, partial [Nitrospirae bacterium]|nr:hypothetical protein [Fimbriimonadaceae bacterium]
VKAALAHAGKPRAKVLVCQDSSQRGDSTVINERAIRDLIDLYPMNDLYVLCVDRDCDKGRPLALRNLETAINTSLTKQKFVTACGLEELEVWVLAGMTDLPDNWADVKADCHPKETYFEPHAERRQVLDTPGRGRKVLGEEAATKYATRVRTMCPEIQVCEVP